MNNPENPAIENISFSKIKIFKLLSLTLYAKMLESS